jgi:hypothetical protein
VVVEELKGNGPMVKDLKGKAAKLGCVYQEPNTTSLNVI